MKFVLFYHSLVSDWNHGNAHFLRGIATELVLLRHEVVIFEPSPSWSAQNLMAEHGCEPFRKFHEQYPLLKASHYDPNALDLDMALDGADVVLVHEWNEPRLVSEIGRHHRGNGGYRLLFHDTHHRMATDPASMAKYDLSDYDGVLAYGRVLSELYERTGHAARAWTWHEAADTRVFHPWPGEAADGDLVWVGNWGDGERTAELQQFLLQPCKKLGLRTRVYGVRYPEEAKRDLADAGIDYAGWLPNFEVPRAFARYRVTVHIPRRPYVQTLPGIPTIRPFEALACGIPLVCSTWDDSEGLFNPGKDYLVARDGQEMARHLKAILQEEALRQVLIRNGLNTILTRHTCAHRVEELLDILSELGKETAAIAAPEVSLK